jgi:hypothetical protein
MAIAQPHVLSPEIQNTAMALDAPGQLGLDERSPSTIQKYLDVLTGADVIAEERARTARSGEPHHVIALYVLCLWPNKPAFETVARAARDSLSGAYLSSTVRDSIFERMGDLLRTGSLHQILSFFASGSDDSEYRQRILRAVR